MDNLFYKITVVLTLWLVVFGTIDMVRAVYQFVRGGGLPTLGNVKPIIVARFLSGAARIVIGWTLYSHVNESTRSTVMVSLSMSVFVLSEWYFRTYFAPRDDNNNLE